MFPPTQGQLSAIIEDLKEEIKKRQGMFAWSGGTIPSNFKPYFADVDPQGNFRKVYFDDGTGRREFFKVASN